MTKEEDFKLLKIQTFVLKVNIHCDGCKQKVRKLLQRIEGVYQVNIDAEQQKVTVSGTVDSATLIKKLVRAGKHAELWSQKSSQNQKQKSNCIKDEKNNKNQKQGLMKGLEAFKSQQKFPAFISEDDDFYDDDEEDDEEDELQLLKANQLGQFNLLRQQAIDANNAKKGGGVVGAPIASNNNNKMNNNVGNGNAAAKKGNNPNQNLGGMKVMNPPGGIDQKTMAALKMNNVHLGGGGGGGGDVRRGNDINAMMGLAGFHGNGCGNNVNNAAAAAASLGGNPNGLGGFQAVQLQPNNGYQNSPTAMFPNGGYATGGQYPPSVLMNMNGYNNHPSTSASQMMMNLNMQNRHHAMQQQPQMMYHRSPFIPPSTGYYYNHNPVPYSYPTEQVPNYSGDHHSSAAHMFSDENPNSCSIM